MKLKQWQETEKDFLRQTGFKRQRTREQVAGFGKSQAAKAGADARKYYEGWSKSVGANISIKTLANYYDVKYNDSPRYKLLKRYVDDVNAGRLSPLIGFDGYEEAYNRIENEIVGKETSNGIRITGQSRHFMQRVVGTMHDLSHSGKKRDGVEIEDISDALMHGTLKPVRVNEKTGERSQVLASSACGVSINPDTGILIQCNLL